MHSINCNKEIGKVFTKSFLEKENSVKPVKQIAKENNCAPSTVRKYLYKYDIKVFNSRKGKKPWNRVDIIEHNGRIYVYDEEIGLRRKRAVWLMEQHIKRRLFDGEVVHHLNGDATDDRIENLILMEKRQHDRFHMIIRNKTKSYKFEFNDTWTASKVLTLLKPIADNKMKRYAELTRIVKV